MEDYRIVSNTHGEIERIIIKTFTPGHHWNEHYNGLAAVIPESKITGILQIIPTSPQAYRSMNEQYFSQGAPQNFAQAIKMSISSQQFNKLKNKYKDKVDFDLFEKGKIENAFLVPSIKDSIEQDIKKAIHQYSAEQFREKYPHRAMPKLMIEIDWNDDSMSMMAASTSSTPGRSTMFFLQDPVHALQKFDDRKSIKIVYSSKVELFKNTARILKDSLPNIDIASVDFNIFEGGNFLPSENNLFIGMNFLQYNLIGGETETGLKQKLSDLFKIPNILFTGMKVGTMNLPGQTGGIGYHYQPIFHIDMFFTPAGEAPNGKKLIFLGQVDTALYQNDYLEDSRKKVIKDLNELIQTTAESVNTNNEFEFIKLPFFVKFSNNSGTLDRIVAYASFNNAIVEITRTGKKYYMSDYADESYARFSVAKERVRSVLNAYGFETKFVSPPADLLVDGALHCYTKVLWRKPY